MSNIKVSCRLRPPNRQELKNNGVNCMSIHDGNTVVVRDDEFECEDMRCTFDNVYGDESTQRMVYEGIAKPLISEIFNGFNCTILAYGQTGSGKTHTMMGKKEVLEAVEKENGVIPRLIEDMFAQIESFNGSGIQYSVKMSFIELYLERIRDLLEPSNKELKIRQDSTKGIHIDGAFEIVSTKKKVIQEFINRGNRNRSVSSTKMNKDSSRSHSILILTLFQKDKDQQTEKSGKMFLVDLAGSELVNKTHAKDIVLKEAKMINRSLSAIGNVIKALVESKTHIPYLTRILQESLGGNCKTSLLITGSSNSFNLSETLSTLRFGIRAKQIKNKAVSCQQDLKSEYSQLYIKAKEDLREQQMKIESLNQDLRTKSKKEISLENNISRLIAEIAEIKKDKDTMKAEIEQLQNVLILKDIENEDYKLILAEKAEEISTLSAKYEDLKLKPDCSCQTTIDIYEKSAAGLTAEIKELKELLDVKELETSQLMRLNEQLTRENKLLEVKDKVEDDDTEIESENEMPEVMVRSVGTVSELEVFDSTTAGIDGNIKHDAADESQSMKQLLEAKNLELNELIIENEKLKKDNEKYLSQMLAKNDEIESKNEMPEVMVRSVGTVSELEVFDSTTAGIDGNIKHDAADESQSMKQLLEAKNLELNELIIENEKLKKDNEKYLSQMLVKNDDYQQRMSKKQLQINDLNKQITISKQEYEEKYQILRKDFDDLKKLLAVKELETSELMSLNLQLAREKKQQLLDVEDEDHDDTEIVSKNEVADSSDYPPISGDVSGGSIVSTQSIHESDCVNADSSLALEIENLTNQIIESKTKYHYLLERTEAMVGSSKLNDLVGFVELKIQFEKSEDKVSKFMVEKKAIEEHCLKLESRLLNREEHIGHLQQSVREYQIRFKQELMANQVKEVPIVRDLPKQRSFNFSWFKPNKSEPDILGRSAKLN